MSLVDDLAVEAVSRLDETFSLALGSVPPPGPWARHGRCRTVPPGMFFPERGDDTSPAKAICAGCAVRVQCLEWALDAGHELHGIWGGESRRGRARIRAQREAQQAEAHAEAADEVAERRAAAAPGTLYRLLEQLLEHPGRPARLASYTSRQSGFAVASMLRTGRRPSPPGRWEFEGRQYEHGSALYACYLGPLVDAVAAS